MPVKAPAFTLTNHAGQIRCLSHYFGWHLILYFYPKNNTPGCTKSGQDFSALVDQFRQKQAIIVGVSRDSVDSHRRFREKHQLTCELLSDESGECCEAYDVWQEKKNYGKVYMGIVRTTIWINPNGIIHRRWSPVKVAGHAQSVYDALTQYQE